MSIRRLRPVLAITLALLLLLMIGGQAFAQPVERVPVLIGLQKGLGPEKRAQLEDEIKAAGGVVTHKYRIVDAFAAQIPQKAINRIIGNQEIRMVIYQGDSSSGLAEIRTFFSFRTEIKFGSLGA